MEHHQVFYVPFSAPFGGNAGCESSEVTAQPWRSFTVVGGLAIGESCVPQILERVGPFTAARICSFS